MHESDSSIISGMLFQKFDLFHRFLVGGVAVEQGGEDVMEVHLPSSL